MRAIEKMSAAGILAGLLSCATIVSTGKHDYKIESNPIGARVAVLLEGNTVAELTTPAVYQLSMKNNYAMRFSLKGYKDTVVVVEKDVNGWVWGNILIGGLIGVVIDLSTGAWYKPADGVAQVTVTLEKEDKTGMGESAQYAIVKLTDDRLRVATARIPLAPGHGTEKLRFNDYLVQN